MSSTVYTTDSFSHPTQAQQDFTAHFDPSEPLSAIHDYAKTMAMHTKRQMENATKSSRRRAPNANSDVVATSAMSTLHGQSTGNSMSSTNSVDSSMS